MPGVAFPPESMESTPLPENTFVDRASRLAYDQCLALEADDGVQHIQGYPPPQVCARLIGHLFRLAPIGSQARLQLQRDIAECSDDAKFMELAIFYMKNFVRAFMRSSGPTPPPSDHPSHPECFVNERDYAETMLSESRLDYRSARKWAMQRDNNRCMITGLVDFRQPDGQISVQTAHIIPESTTTNIGEPSRKHYQSANVWANFKILSRSDVTVDLAGRRIHRLENIISLNISAHQLFDTLHLWLKPMEGLPHQYRVCTARDRHQYSPPLPEFVAFTTDTQLPLPNPEYLGLHALSCEVAWMSGGAEYIADIERRMEDALILENDGSTTDLLTAALNFRAD